MKFLNTYESYKTSTEEFELEEIERTIDDLELDITPEDLLQKFKDAINTPITSNILNKLENSDWKDVSTEKDVKRKMVEYGKDIENYNNIVREIEKNTQYQYPVLILRLSYDRYYLVAGNTRLMVAKIKDILPYGKVVHYSIDDQIIQLYEDLLYSFKDFVPRVTGYKTAYNKYQQTQTFQTFDAIEVYEHGLNITSPLKFYYHEDSVIIHYKKDSVFIEFIEEILNKYCVNRMSVNKDKGTFIFKNKQVYDAINIFSNTTKDDYLMFVNSRKYNL